jgi:hypothetical protein
MNTFNVYSVEYVAGLGGTWLTSFINRHLGVEHELEYNPIERDYLLIPNSPIVWEYEEQTFESLIQKHNKSFAYKISPHHNWFLPNPLPIPANNTHKRFMPYVDKTLRQEFIDRRILQIKLADGMESTANNPFFKQNSSEFVDDGFNRAKTSIEHHSNLTPAIVPIDIGKLTNNSDSEYNYLIDQLEVEPLKNKAKLVAEYRRDALGQVGYSPFN